MNKEEFLQQLESFLSDVTPTEREEALLYYRDYIEDAGVENEPNVLAELGSPQKLAEDIKAGLGMKQQTAYGPGNADQVNHPPVPPKNTKKNPSQIILIVILIIITSPFWGGILGTIVGFLAGVFALIVGALLVTLCVGIALIFSCIAIIVMAIAKALLSPLVSVFLIGAGLLCGSIGILFLILFYLLCAKAIPALIRGIVYLCRLPFHKPVKEEVHFE